MAQTMTTCLWFDGNAEEAVSFYTSVFKNSRVLQTTHYGKEGFEFHGRPEGSVMTIVFEINGQEFLALNGGPHFKFSEAVSIVVNCDTQEEIDYLWKRLSHHKEAEACGWLKDKFGLSWQITPKMMSELFADPVSTRSERTMHAMLKMKKLDIATLKRAYEG